MKQRREFLKESVLAGAGLAFASYSGFGKLSGIRIEDLRLGIIGLDTSHSPAFIKLINDDKNPMMKGIRVTAAYPYGSRTIESSYSRIPGYIEEVKALGVDIVDSIDALLNRVDGVLLETNDGKPHYEQALQVYKAGKPIFIDKPVGASLADVIKIYNAAQDYNVQVFSSSGLRFLKKAQAVRHESIIGEVTGADAFSPSKYEPSHTDLFWYGIHGVEILYTLMGTGCKSVQRIITEETDMVIGKWGDGRIGTFRGDRYGRQNYGGTAFGSNGVVSVGPFAGYGPLVEKIVEFFRTNNSPVSREETLELYTFMEAADVSRDRKGAWVELKDVFEKAGG